MGYKGDVEKRPLFPHEIDAITAALTAHLYLEERMKLVGETKEDYIVVPLNEHYKRLLM